MPILLLLSWAFIARWFSMSCSSLWALGGNNRNKVVTFSNSCSSWYSIATFCIIGWMSSNCVFRISKTCIRRTSWISITSSRTIIKLCSRSTWLKFHWFSTTTFSISRCSNISRSKRSTWLCITCCFSCLRILFYCSY